jgi:UDP-glucose 4-epimerase
MSRPKIGVTGAAGYVGPAFIKEIQMSRMNVDIVAVDNFSFDRGPDFEYLDVKFLDIRNWNRIQQFLSTCDVVVHLAALSGVDVCREDPDLAFRVNVQGTENIAWMCRKHDVGLVFPLSMAMLGEPSEFPVTVDTERDPQNWYGETKLMGERAIESLSREQIPVVMLLKSNLYGGYEINGQWISKGTVIDFFIEKALDGDDLPVYEPGSQSRNYVHVVDAARAYVKATQMLLDRDDDGVEKYEVASDEDFSVMDVARLVTEFEDDIEIEMVENPRSEALSEKFSVDTSRTEDDLEWERDHSVTETIQERMKETDE